MGLRRRNRLLDVRKLLQLLQCSDLEAFQSHLNSAIQEAIDKDHLQRQAKWTEAIAVGSQSFVESIELLESHRSHRREFEMSEDSDTWVLRENYGAIF
jgi:hypothetical protein